MPNPTAQCWLDCRLAVGLAGGYPGRAKRHFPRSVGQARPLNVRCKHRRLRNISLTFELRQLATRTLRCSTGGLVTGTRGVPATRSHEERENERGCHPLRPSRRANVPPIRANPSPRATPSAFAPRYRRLLPSAAAEFEGHAQRRTIENSLSRAYNDPVFVCVAA